jgi:DNA-binding transcriptional ArsR family regulator
MIEIKKGHSLKIVSAVMSIIFLCNSTGYSFNLLRVPFSSYSRIQKVYYTYSKSSLAHIFDFLENIIQPRTAEEISKSSDVNLSPETVRRTLNSLYKLGLIVRGKKDNKIVYSLVPLSPLQRLDIRNILTSSLPHSRPTKAELQKIVPSIKSILRRTDLIKEKRKALAFPPTLSFQDSEPMARDIKALNEQVRIEQLKIQIDTKKTVKLDKSEDCEERVINGYPLEIRPDITHIIAASQIDHRRAKRHALRLLESDRTSVENQFARALFRFYEHRLLGTRTYFKPDLPRYIGTYYVMSFEGYSTTLFWTLAPYLYDRLIKLNIDEKVAFEIICAWVKQVAEKKYYARGRDFYFRNYLIGLDMLRLEEFYLLKRI